MSYNESDGAKAITYMEMYPRGWRIRIRNRVTSLLAPFAETVDLQAFNALMIGLCAWISLHQFSPFSEVDFWADVEDKYTESYRSGHNGPHSKSCEILLKLHIYDTEEYRSGHNEPHSKCGCPQGHVGSNPTSSAIEKSSNHAGFWIFLFLRPFQKSPGFGLFFS